MAFISIYFQGAPAACYQGGLDYNFSLQTKLARILLTEGEYSF